MSVVSEKRRACVEGFVGIEIASELSFEQSKGRFFELAEKVLPVHLKALHLVNSPPTTVGEKKFFGTILPATLKVLGATAYRRAHVHTRNSKEEIHEILKARGFFSDGLPECVGGTWTYDNFSKWQTERRRVEEEIHLIADVYQQYSQKPTSLGPIFVPAEEGKEIGPQKRSMNSVYSRRKRVKRNLSVQALKDEGTRLTYSNEKLKRDNDFLERLLATVEASIARHEHLVPRTIPGSVAQHQLPLGLSKSRGGASAHQPTMGLSTNRLPLSSSFGNIGTVLGLQRSIEEQQVLGRLAHERRMDSLRLDQDVMANRASLLAHQMRQQHGQLQLSEIVAPQATVISPGIFYPAGSSPGDGSHGLPMAPSNPPMGYAVQEAAPQANPPDHLELVRPHFGQPPPP
jgi:hypothetical protein